jgi:putative transposase
MIAGMPNYRRYFQSGGTYFFTVKTFKKQRFLSQDKARTLLREVTERVRNERPFEIPAMVLLPDHLHAIWKLPDGDQDFSQRWSLIKRRFTLQWLQTNASCNVTPAMRKRHEQGVWQKRFWEHLIRDGEDFGHHMNYIHYNPVKHRLVECPHDWPWSSFHRWVKEGAIRADWLCSCRSRKTPPVFPDHLDRAGE